MYLRKRPGGDNWFICWTEPGRRSRRLSTGTSDKRAAEAALARFRVQRLAPPDRCDVNDICDGYLADRKRKPVTAYETLFYSLMPVREHFGALPPRLVTRALVRDYITKRRDNTTRPKRPGGVVRKLSDGTINKELRIFRAALNWAVKEQWIDRAPHIDMPSGGAARERWLSKDEVQQLLAAAREHHVELFIIVGIHSGGRCGAILQLTWDMIDLEGGFVNYPPETPGSNKRTVVTPINDTLRRALERAREVAVTSSVIEYREKGLKSITKGFQAAVRRSGIKHCTAHDLRRTCGSWMLQAGASFAQVAAFLGDTEEVIRKHYGHFSPDWLRSAARSLD